MVFLPSFEKNKMQGSGLIKFFDGNLKIANWKNNVMDGSCFHFYKQQLLWKHYLYKNGKFIKEIQKENVSNENG